MISKLSLIIIFILSVLSCQNKKQEINPQERNPEKERGKLEMKISSSSFKEGEIIPSRYTCDGENVSPQLSWTDAPDGVMSFAIICDDPDAPSGDWVHWVVYNIPLNINELKENFPRNNILKDGTKQGLTDFRKTGYDGPCPPAGIHRYYFKLYALDNLINRNDLTKKELLKEMEGHIISNTELIGKYKRIGE